MQQCIIIIVYLYRTLTETNMTTFRNNEYFATVTENKYGKFVVTFGYENEGRKNDAYGQTTCTGIKVYKNEKTAIKKAQQYLG